MAAVEATAGNACDGIACADFAERRGAAAELALVLVMAVSVRATAALAAGLGFSIGFAAFATGFAARSAIGRGGAAMGLAGFAAPADFLVVVLASFLADAWVFATPATLPAATFDAGRAVVRAAPAAGFADFFATGLCALAAGFVSLECGFNSCLLAGLASAWWADSPPLEPDERRDRRPCTPLLVPASEPSGPELSWA